MPISNISRVKTIGIKLNVNSDEVRVIYSNAQATVGNELLPGYRIVSFNTFLKNLKLYASLNSLPEASLPDFKLEDSQTEKLQKVLDVEWNSPRKQLDVYLQSNNAEWLQIGSTSIISPSGYPFRIYNLMDLFTDNLALELGDNSKVGVRVTDVGYGLLTDLDLVTIHGSYVEEIYLESKEPPININVSVAGGGEFVTPITDYTIGNASYINNAFLVRN